MRFVGWTGLVVFVISAAGCGNSPSKIASTPKSGVVEKPAAKQADATASEVTADIKSWEEIQTWVTSQRGKIVVLDIWSNS